MYRNMKLQLGQQKQRCGSVPDKPPGKVPSWVPPAWHPLIDKDKRPAEKREQPRVEIEELPPARREKGGGGEDGDRGVTVIDI